MWMERMLNITCLSLVFAPVLEGPLPGFLEQQRGRVSIDDISDKSDDQSIAALLKHEFHFNWNQFVFWEKRCETVRHSLTEEILSRYMQMILMIPLDIPLDFDWRSKAKLWGMQTVSTIVDGIDFLPVFLITYMIGLSWVDVFFSLNKLTCSIVCALSRCSFTFFQKKITSYYIDDSFPSCGSFQLFLKDKMWTAGMNGYRRCCKYRDDFMISFSLWTALIERSMIHFADKINVKHYSVGIVILMPYIIWPTCALAESRCSIGCSRKLFCSASKSWGI